MKFLLFPLLLLSPILAREVTKPGDWTTVPGVGRVDHLLSFKRKRSDNPLDQNIPEKRNTHKEFVPVFRKAEGTCNCAPAVCPPVRMTSGNVISCQNAHAWACWKKNPACPNPRA